jgi:hypothetical protein
MSRSAWCGVAVVFWCFGILVFCYLRRAPSQGKSGFTRLLVVSARVQDGDSRRRFKPRNVDGQTRANLARL